MKVNKTIKDAAKKIKGGEYLIRAFAATRESDLFNGDIEKYLKIIAVRLEAQNLLIKKYEEAMENLYKNALKQRQEIWKEKGNAKEAMWYSRIDTKRTRNIKSQTDGWVNVLRPNKSK
jgi:hypothetical protein